ncbi:hypothetical protein PSN45_002911 [Yamadazyma tenuis]|uniref:RNA polymerase II-associated n=1 Tax=Candida tenuis (strain ATCC 10573 / BCRC 21748 / CBS 615 / JCM 9827 / NBRC 10315 / NRRL Y-1498 / VKM Y-70) TaxID=590646 RepID=G3AWA2_CANTC|nr:RNA polymerase II-associated [Yamadazyma tenuis ATCC 10573]EGV66496.1 RNA polymerase II-associated [Yamadazyma tenuis ATCC 10573]WEJ95392.1 hypothetical protein PSN45_002911 [Yamadazyma tenuis]
MSSKPSKPVRQDFIAKARYINNLPPPPITPKFIKPQTTEKLSREEEADQILSSLFRKDNFKNLIENIDDENGMNLNLIHNHGVLDNNDIKSIVKERNSESVELHPNDRILLRDAGIGKISRKEPEVSFLRRTEYISERAITKNAIESGSNGKQEEEKFDSETQLKAVERTFDVAQESLKDFKKLVHPTKKHLKAVNAWPLLPDTSMMDSKFLTIKLSGSASVKREWDTLKTQQKDKYDENLQRKIISTAVFKPITSNDGEWMSLYEDTSKEEVERLYEALNSEDPNKPSNLVTEDQNDKFGFKFIRNYDMSFQKYSKPLDELSIKFVTPENSKKRRLAHYYPVTGKIDLRKYRTSGNSQINKFVRESTFDTINYTLREPNTDEMRKMDNIRSEFDPMEYEGEEEPETKEEDSDKQNGDAEQDNE